MIEENTGTDEVRQTLAEGYQELEDRYLVLRDQASVANRRAVEFVQEHPVACLSGALAVGFLVGTIAKHRWLV